MAEDKEKIKAMIILQVIGKPKEHLTSTLKMIAQQMALEEGVSVKGSDIKEPRKMEQKVGTTEDSDEENQKGPQDDFYMSFAEIEVETEGMMHFMVLLFKYMPAHVDIISPENLSMSNNGWNEIMNELIRRLHAFDEVVRVTQVEKEILEKQLRTIVNQNSKNAIEGKTEKKAEKK